MFIQCFHSQNVRKSLNKKYNKYTYYEPLKRTELKHLLDKFALNFCVKC